MKVKISSAAVAIAVLVTVNSGSAYATTFSSGFESGPTTPVIAFTPADDDGLGWKASNTDGERFSGTPTKLPKEGNYYASLLQNGGAYNGAPLGVGDFGFTGFDRIYAEFSTMTSTNYDVSFWHAGDNRFDYFAGSSVVEIVDVDTNATLDQRVFATPGLFDWQQVAFSFNSGTTTNAAVATTVMGSGGTSGVFDAVEVHADTSPIPVPGGLVLLVTSLGGLAVVRRRAR